MLWTVALKQTDVQLRFEILYLARHGWLGYMQNVGGLRYAAFLGYRQKGTQNADIHGGPVSCAKSEKFNFEVLP